MVVAGRCGLLLVIVGWCWLCLVGVGCGWLLLDVDVGCCYDNDLFYLFIFSDPIQKGIFFLGSLWTCYQYLFRSCW